jgi:UDP-N-acetylglucosamine:LPS N-acetylglucosamine transferase
MDLHLVPDSLPARLVEEAGGRAAPVRIPTGARRTSAEERVKTRAALGIPEGAFVALVSGGAWGAGSLESAARRALKCGCHVVVATGKNAGLRARLKERLGYLDRVHVLGWRDDLPQILAASDCLIQNAGGMTCLEALDLGVPIISFEPIAGHGQYNARIMEQAGVAVWARTSETLKDLLRPAVRGERPLPRPRREPGLPSAAEALEALVEEFVRKARA